MKQKGSPLIIRFKSTTPIIAQDSSGKTFIVSYEKSKLVEHIKGALTAKEFKMVTITESQTADHQLELVISAPHEVLKKIEKVIEKIFPSES